MRAAFLGTVQQRVLRFGAEPVHVAHPPDIIRNDGKCLELKPRNYYSNVIVRALQELYIVEGIAMVRREIKRLIPLLVWVALIFVLPNVLNLSGDGPKLPKRFDKVIHFVEYMVLAVLFYRGLVYPPERERMLVFFAVLCAGLAIGALDEFTQYYLPHRNSSIMDWLADAAGILVGTSLASVRYRRMTQ